MTDLTVDRTNIPGGYRFIRSDGQRFFMIAVGDRGSAALYVGNSPDRPPAVSIVEFDVNVADKLDRATVWVLAYPGIPDHS